MALLGDATTVSAQTGRKLNNALTMKFKTSADHTLATAVQAKSLGVLFGFRNGGYGRYTISGTGDDLIVDCAKAQTQITTSTGEVVGTIETGEKGDGVLRDAAHAEVGRILAYPKDQVADFAWKHPLTDAQGQALGVLTWVRAGKFDLVGELNDLYIWWDRAGQSLKVPSLGAHLALDQAAPAVLGDLLLAACVDMALGSHSYITK